MVSFMMITRYTSMGYTDHQQKKKKRQLLYKNDIQKSMSQLP
jgi:tmRNA-binding protein